MPLLLPNPWALGLEVHFHEPHDLFAPLGIDNLVLGEWLVMAVLITVALLINRRIAKVPNTRLQAGMEALLSFLEGWLAGFVGSRKEARKYLPLLATLFLFILLSNYSGILPTAGQSWSFFPPTGKWGTTIGLGLVVMVAVQVISIQELGVKGWLSHLLETHYGAMAILMAPLRILEEFVRPFSLSLRLFGNIFAEEVLLLIVSTLAPLLAPVPIMGLSLLFGLIQAIVFTTLTAIYIGGVVEAKAHLHRHGHGHDHHGAQGALAHAHGH
ncbi:MAG: F0F1 ATP synthase subunit A [Bacillota bacterium]